MLPGVLAVERDQHARGRARPRYSSASLPSSLPRKLIAASSPCQVEYSKPIASDRPSWRKKHVSCWPGIAIGRIVEPVGAVVLRHVGGHQACAQHVGSWSRPSAIRSGRSASRAPRRLIAPSDGQQPTGRNPKALGEHADRLGHVPGRRGRRRPDNRHAQAVPSRAALSRAARKSCSSGRIGCAVGRDRQLDTTQPSASRAVARHDAGKHLVDDQANKQLAALRDIEAAATGGSAP